MFVDLVRSCRGMYKSIHCQHTHQYTSTFYYTCASEQRCIRYGGGIGILSTTEFVYVLQVWMYIRPDIHYAYVVVPPSDLWKWADDVQQHSITQFIDV